MTLEPRRFVRSGVVAAMGAVLFLSGCTDGVEVAEPTLEAVVLANTDAGMDRSVAECVAGIGSRELPLSVLVPEVERTPTQSRLIDELVDSCEEASAFVLNEPAEPDTLAFDVGPYTLGDDPGFDRLWERCELGDGEACDELWEAAPVGSDYERFGVTCGDRDQLLDCSAELTEETVEDIDAAIEAKLAEREARADTDGASGSSDPGEPS